jgi:hypothetical protein
LTLQESRMQDERLNLRLYSTIYTRAVNVCMRLNADEIDKSCSISLNPLADMKFFVTSFMAVTRAVAY